MEFAVAALLVFALSGGIFAAAAWVGRQIRALGSNEARRADLESQALRRAKADDLRARPRPSEDAVDAWMDPPP